MTVRNRIFIPMIAPSIGCGGAVLLSSILLFGRELNEAMRDKTIYLILITLVVLVVYLVLARFIAGAIERRLEDMMSEIREAAAEGAAAAEAARREQLEEEPEIAADAQEEVELRRFLTKGAKKAIRVFESITVRADGLYEEELESYITAAHGVKNALANIGEKDLSDYALRLEEAGKEWNFAVMSRETPAFVSALKALVAKLRAAAAAAATAGSAEVVVSDSVYLRNRLLDIKDACEVFDINSAKAALDDLRRKTWSAQTNSLLDEIEDHLLHGVFSEAAEAADRTTEE